MSQALMTGGCECFYLEDLLTQYQPSMQGRCQKFNPLPSCCVAVVDNYAHAHELWLCLLHISEKSTNNMLQEMHLSQEPDGPHLHEQRSASTVTSAPSFPSNSV